MIQTTHATIARPDGSEYAPYYARYVEKVPDGPLLDVLEHQHAELQALLDRMGEERGGHRYAPGKWSVKEVIGHLTDSERIFSYRAMRIARGDRTPLASFEQDDYVRNGGFDSRALTDLRQEAEAVRRATVLLFASLDAEAVQRRGVASGADISVRALGYIIAGHERHHLDILRERYA